MAVRYVVLNEHTLGYIADGSPFMGVLAGKVAGGGYDPKNGPVAIAEERDSIRPATQADFVDFRVSPVGHLPGNAETASLPDDDETTATLRM